MIRPRKVALPLAGAIVGLGVALALPGDERALALFAYVLLLGGTASALLVILARRANPAPAEVLWDQPVPPPQRVPQLEDIAADLGTVLELGGDPSGEFRARLRIVAAARLEDRRGIELDRQPGRARAAIDDELTWRLVQERKRFEPVALPTLGPAELSRILASLERI